MNKLLDVQTGFGGVFLGEKEIPSAEGLASEMERVNVSGGLIRIVPDGRDCDFVLSNSVLVDTCGDREEWWPCPVLVPSGGQDVDPEDVQVDNAIQAGAGAVCLRPKQDDWVLVEWVSDNLFRELQDRNMPVFMSRRYFSFNDVAAVSAGFPRLPVILGEIGYRDQRSLLPLMDNFSNVRLSIGSNYCVDHGIEQIAGMFGAERLLFGTGYPESDAMPWITQLMYAGISDEEREMIGCRNLLGLMEGIH